MIAPVARLRVAIELWRWRRLGLRPTLWWRDDDAREATPELERLLTAAADRPLALAVIPDGDIPQLAERLRRSPNVSIGQHGVDHIDRSQGAPPSEHPADATSAVLAKSIGAARARMEAASLPPVFFTPPWNACQPALPGALVASGFQILSAGKDAPTAENGLDYLPAEIDILRWKTGARFKGASRVMRALRKALATRRRGKDPRAPIGLLTHHLVHDEESWRFLAWFLTYTDARFDWTSVERGSRSINTQPN